MAFLVDNLYILDTRKPQMHRKTPSRGGVIKRVVDVLQGDTVDPAISRSTSVDYFRQVSEFLTFGSVATVNDFS